jgi:hypothetical protein
MARIDRKTGAIATFARTHLVYYGGHRRHYEIVRNARDEALPVSVVARIGQRQCEALREAGGLHPALGTPVWLPPRASDCNYQKFLYFMQAAVAYGLTTEVIEVRGSAGGGKAAGPSTRVVICYDPAIAQEYGRKVPKDAACGLKEQRRRPSYADLGPHVRVIQPIMRSTYSVFQYYGRILPTDTARRVRLLDAGSARLPTGDRQIFTVSKGGAEGGCFASAAHDGDLFCVPRKGAGNTKEIFALLNALVNLSTTRSALPITPTVQIAP